MNDIPRQQLESAFAILLQQPLESFDPCQRYVYYFWDDQFSSDFFDHFGPKDLDDMEQVQEDRSAAAHDSGEPTLSWDRLSVCLARSYFLLEECLVDDFPRAAREALGEVSTITDECHQVLGKDLARIIRRHEVDTAVLEMIPILARARTDGSLLDAMKAATWTMGGYGGLVMFDRDLEVEPQWQARLTAIEDLGLRTHLGQLCLTEEAARCDGAYFAGQVVHLLEGLKALPSHTLLAAWELGEGQACSAVFQVQNE